MDYKERYRIWTEKLPAGDPLRAELLAIAGNENEIRERFGKELTFGTAGLRGKTGAGTNRMNRLTVGRAAQGLSDYISERGDEAKRKGVIIAHDPRHFSEEFSRLTAEVFAANGIRAYVFDGMRPTPELAFLIRRLGTVSGVNITASHNPKEYNGFKAYWEDGCQVSSGVADGIMAKIEAADYFEGVRALDFENAKARGLITVLGAECDKAYLDEIASLAVRGDDSLDLAMPIVYTPLNGAGAKPFAAMMERRGFANWKMVPEQAAPDPDFSTVGYPNPEDPKAFALAEKLGKTFGAELIMATDPDADRFAAEILKEDGSYLPLNGNQTGYLLVKYILEGRKEAGTLPENGADGEVGRDLHDSRTRIAASYGVKMFEALTGFKNICGRIPELEEKGLTYLFGYEESVGYAASPNIRDKDGISAGMLLAEAAAYYRKKGKTLERVLEEIYEDYGAFAEGQRSVVLEGLEGAARIERMMESLRKEPPAAAAGIRVERIVDYSDGHRDIPPSNVLRYFLADGSWFAVRPSGTEPKIKLLLLFVRRGPARGSSEK